MASLNARDAKLRAEALYRIDRAAGLLDRGYAAGASALRDALYNRTGAALRRIAAAEKHLALAKRALKAWDRCG